MKKLALLLLLLPLSLTVIAASRSRGARISESLVPTFNREIVRIFQQNCQSCHHPGDVAPFSLMSHGEAYPYRHLIKLMTQTREMPPWKAAEGCGEFEGERRLAQKDIDLIAQWVDAGAPEGRPEDLPAALEFKDGWAIGEPDLVLTMPQPYTPPASREMYRCFSLPAGNTESKWVSSIDVRPGQRETVHHVIAFLDPDGTSVRLDAQDPDPGYQCFGGPGFLPTGSLGGWAPGSRPVSLPDGVGLELSANARVVMQVHYHVHDAQAHPDQTSIGIYYSDKPVTKKLYFVPLVNTTFVIPPGAKDFQVQDTLSVFFPVRVHLVSPHMHLLGKRMKVEATLPNGETQCLIDIPDWDFNWQGFYQFKNPVLLPAFSQARMTAWYDNSSDNPRNPNDPPKPVGWGEATTDEMALAVVGVTLE